MGCDEDGSADSEPDVRDGPILVGHSNPWMLLWCLG